MNWEQARALLQLRRPGRPGWSGRTGGQGQSQGQDQGQDQGLVPTRASSICVVSGKGGTGKSLVAASLATVLSRHGRTLVVDADLGVANAHILQDVTPEHSFVDVVEGRREVREIVARVSEHLDLLAGGSGFSRVAGLSPLELHLIASGLDGLELEYRSLVVDCAAGISPQTVAFAAASDVVLLVTTPDLTAMTDAYAFLKVLLRRKANADPMLVVNRATDAVEAHHCAERIRDVSRKFLGREPRWIASLPEDRAAFRSTQRRRPVVTSEPDSPLALALEELAQDVLQEFERCPPLGVGHTLLRRVAYTPKLA